MLKKIPGDIPVNVILLPMEGDPYAAAAFWGLAFFGETPDVWTAGGAGLIVLSTLAIARLRPRDPVATDAAEAVPATSANPSAR